MCEVEDRTLTSFGLDFLPTLTNLGGAACALCAWSVRYPEKMPSVAPCRPFANLLILSACLYIRLQPMVCNCNAARTACRLLP